MRKTSFLVAAVIATLVFAPGVSRSQDLRGQIEDIVRDYLANHPDEVGAIAKDYMLRHPEAMAAILAQMLKLRSAHAGAGAGAPSPAAYGAKAADEHGAAIKSNAAALFSSPHQVTLGNANGDITLVEFFDYSCGFCRRALPDMLALMRDDPHLRIVLKELPVLGPGSAEAARIAVAVRMQDPDGQKYLAFHRALLGTPGPASREKALAVAKDEGLDMERLERDAASDEVKATLSEDAKLAGAMGIHGTPGYVVGNDVVLGAVGLAALKERIEAVRNHGVN
jgi:protein-disulfide isomerase